MSEGMIRTNRGIRTMNPYRCGFRAISPYLTTLKSLRFCVVNTIQTNNVLFARKPAASRIGLSVWEHVFQDVAISYGLRSADSDFSLDTDFQIWTLQNKHCWTGFLS